jgi:hypothetical protein
MNESTPRHSYDHSRAGVCGEDVGRLDRALNGITYPAPKWLLLAHANLDTAGRGHTNSRAIDLLWALPADDYRDRAQVLAAAARTARGHPHRPVSEPTLERTVAAPRSARGRSPHSRASPRLAPGARGRLATQLADLYQDGRSLHQISTDTGHSYGYVRRLVLDAGTRMRPRGGDHRPTAPPVDGSGA